MKVRPGPPEHVRVTVLEQIQNDDPLTADFGPEECVYPTFEPVEITIEELTPTPAPEATPRGG